MADKHPYISSTAGLTKAIQHFRSSLPAKIDAAMFKKLDIAPKNESYLINILKFIKVIGEEGVPTTEARKIFSQHDDAGFAKEFSGLVESAYAELFSLHGEKAWQLDTDKLITFFRQSDQTSAVIGGRQATTFIALATFAGHAEMPGVRPAAILKTKKT